MGAFQVIGCTICGKLLQSHGEKICAQCAEQVDGDFLVVRDYINSAKEGVGVNDIVENTGVSEKIVLFLMKEGRLAQDSKMREGTLRCVACGASIQTGKLCSKCSAAWSSEINSRQTQKLEKSKTDNGPLKKGSRTDLSRGKGVWTV